MIVSILFDVLLLDQRLALVLGSATIVTLLQKVFTTTTAPYAAENDVQSDGGELQNQINLYHHKHQIKMLSFYKMLVGLLICNINLNSSVKSPKAEITTESQIERLETRKRELKDQNKVLTTENTELKAQLESRKQRIAELKDANKVLRAQLSKNNQMLEDYWTIFDDKTRLLDVNKRLRQQYEPQTRRDKLVSIDV